MLAFVVLFGSVPAVGAWVAACGTLPLAPSQGFRSTSVRRAAVLKASSKETLPLLDAIEEAGVVGVAATEEQQERVEGLTAALKGKSIDAAQARIPLRGTYDLLYSMSKGGSNGKIGPFVGAVTQIIVDETKFINQVELFNALTVQLHAEREVLSDDRIRVHKS